MISDIQEHYQDGAKLLQFLHFPLNKSIAKQFNRALILSNLYFLTYTLLSQSHFQILKDIK